MQIFLKPYKKYAMVTGRASGREYWGFVLFQLVALKLLYEALMARGLDAMLQSLASEAPLDPAAFQPGWPFYLSLATMVAFVLVSVVPNVAAAARRLHDRGLSGRYLLLVLIPVAGAVALIAMLCLPGNAGANKYGEDPRAIGE